jgi:hypothetical protein
LALDEGPELGLIGHAKHVLLASDNGFEAFPIGYIQEVVVLGKDGTCDRVIGCNSCHGLIGNLPVSPFNTDIVGGSFPHWMILGKGAFMSYNLLEPPYNGVFLQLFNVIHNLVVCHDLLVLVIVDQAHKTHLF